MTEFPLKLFANDRLKIKSPQNSFVVSRILRGLEPSVVLPYVFITIVSVAVAVILLSTEGNVGAAIAFVVALTVVFVSFYKAEWGFYMLFGMVLLFDQFLNIMPFGTPITAKPLYFDNLKQSPYLPSYAIAVMNPIEIQIILIVLGWFIAMMARRTRRTQHVPFWGFALLLFAAIVVSELHGLHSHGNFLPSLWEIRALIYFLLLYFLVPQVIQTREQINVILWIFLVMVTIKALQGGLRFAELGFRFHDFSTLTNHEDPVFMADLFILTIGFFTFGAKVKQRTATVWLLPILLLGFYAGQRRAAYAGFLLILVLFVIMLTPKEKLKFLRTILPLLAVLIGYTIIFWNVHSRIAEPIQLIKSGMAHTETAAGERWDSNLYRDFERYDLAATVQTAPVMGIGFGKKYMMPLPLPDIHFSLQDWIPHDEILWLIVKMGAVGFLIFFMFMDSLMFESARLARSVGDPFLRAIAFMIAAALVNQVVVSYFDLQLTFYRNMVVLGTFCGLLPTIEALGKRSRISIHHPAEKMKILEETVDAET